MSCPKLVTFVVTTARVAVPVSTIFPLARGLIAVGRTRTFCQVSVFGVDPLLAEVTVKLKVVEVTLGVIAPPLVV